MSLLWSVPLEFKKLDVSLGESEDIKILKSKLKRQINNPSMLAPVYNITTVEGCIHHARKRK